MFGRTLTVLLTLFLTGCCCGVGPSKLKTDSLSYNHSVQTSTDQQILLNLVRLRYRDTPGFLDIGVISSAFEVGDTFRLPLTFDNSASPHSIDFTKAVPEFGHAYLEKPTTTYSPLTGEKFVTQLLTPISITEILLLNDMGWRIDRMLRLCVQRINLIQNAPTASGPTPDLAPQFEDFLTLCQALHTLEDDDAVHLLPHYDPETGKAEPVLMLRIVKGDQEALATVWRLLEVPEGTEIMRLIPFNANPRSGTDIHLDTRSPLGLLYFLSHSVNVPPAHEDCHLVTMTARRDGSLFNWHEPLDGLMNIHWGQPQGGAAVCVRYRNTSFYIADDDLESKATFSLISQLLTLQFGAPQLPIVTLPLISE